MKTSEIPFYNQLNRRNFLRYSSAILSTGTFLSACGKEPVEPVEYVAPAPVPPVTEVPAPAVPQIFNISCWGDSLTAGSGGKPYGAILKERMPNRTINIYALGGQQARQISARQGGSKIEITVEGDAFKGTETLKITPISVKFLTNGNTGERTSKGKVAGVACEIIRYCENDELTQKKDIKKEVYTIRPIEASTVAIPPKSIFVPDEAEAARTGVTLLWMGRNDTPRFIPNSVMRSINDSVDYLEKPAKFAILGIVNGINEAIGSENYNAIVAINKEIADKYPDNFIPTTPPTEEEAKAVDYTFTEQDKADIATGCFPNGLRSDRFHLNLKGYTIIANRVEAFLKKNPGY